MLALAVFPLYQATRRALGDRFNVGEQSVGFSEYYQTVVEAPAKVDMSRLYLSNLQGRLTSYYRWQVELASMRNRSGSLNGRLALAGLQYSVPRFVIGSKAHLRWGEELIRSRYGESIPDRPNSLLAAGFADFGVAGSALYAGLFVWVIWGATSFAIYVLRRSPLLGAAVVGSVMLLALRTEISMVGVFASLRDLAILGLVAVCWSVVVRSYEKRVFARGANE